MTTQTNPTRRAPRRHRPAEPAGARILLRLDRGDALVIGADFDELDVLGLAATAALNAAAGVVAIMSREPRS